MRLSQELRNRTKAYASGVIQLYVRLPKEREEIRVLGKQLRHISCRPRTGGLTGAIR
jgi:hypothetical protein